MIGLWSLTKRNNKLFFKDKGMFFTSLITPLILLVLYATFLAKVYRDAFASSIPEGIPVDALLINGAVGGQLLSSLLAVSCVTVAFCSNLLMLQDKMNGARRDLTMTPVKASTLSLSYFVSSAFVTLIICFVAFCAGLIYLAFTGFYLSFVDILLIAFDIVLLVLFGIALSSIINCNLSTNGQGSAVGTIVSSCYGFICGAYMPISNFPESLQKVISFLPGTYGTALLRNHVMRGVYAEMTSQGFPADVVEGIKDSIDCNLYFFGNKVTEQHMYFVLFGAVLLLTVGYIALYRLKKKKL